MELIRFDVSFIYRNIELYVYPAEQMTMLTSKDAYYLTCLLTQYFLLLFVNVFNLLCSLRVTL